MEKHSEGDWTLAILAVVGAVVLVGAAAAVLWFSMARSAPPPPGSGLPGAPPAEESPEVPGPAEEPNAGQDR